MSSQNIKLKIIALTSFITGIVMSTLLVGCNQSPSNTKKIGIVMPIEVKALDEIVTGFKNAVLKESRVPVQFKIANAQGDMNIERAIISQMQAANYDVIIPIGSDATELSTAMVKDKAIVSLASSFTQQQRQQLKQCNIAVVHDEIPVTKQISFLHSVDPKIKTLVLIHSASDKIFPQVKEAIAAGKANGIVVKEMLAPTLNDIYSVANNIPANTQAIFVLKDAMIVNGITTLQIAAAKLHIPLYTSDQGSVQDGAGFSLSVHEKEIGSGGGSLAAKIINGQSPCKLPIVDMTKLTVFVNRKSIANESQSLLAIEAAAKTHRYNIEFVNAGGSNV